MSINEILRKLRLIDSFKVQLEIERIDFIRKLQSAVDTSDLGLLSALNDIFSNQENVFKGHVDYNGFRIKRKKALFSFGNHWPISVGHFKQFDDKLIIHIDIIGLQGYILYAAIFSIAAYLITIGIILCCETMMRETFCIILMILLHGTILLGIFYISFRRNIKKIRKELERAFTSIKK